MPPIEDYPSDLVDFEKRFSTEKACHDYLVRLRWPHGYRCPRCDRTSRGRQAGMALSSVPMLVLGFIVLFADAGSEVIQPLSNLHQQPISLDPSALPGYALRTGLRMLIALGFSLLFTFSYATWAAKSARAATLLIPLLDFLQSVPILAFLSVTLVFFLSLAPGGFWARNSRRFSSFSPARPGTWPSASTNRCAPYRPSWRKRGGCSASMPGHASGGSRSLSGCRSSSGT